MCLIVADLQSGSTDWLELNLVTKETNQESIGPLVDMSRTVKEHSAIDAYGMLQSDRFSPFILTIILWGSLDWEIMDQIFSSIMAKWETDPDFP